MKRNPASASAMSVAVNRALRAAAVITLPVAFGACSWFTDFKRQPQIEPWEPVSQNDADSTTPPRGQPKYSVPIQGVTVAAWQIGYEPQIPVIDSFTPVPNPTPVSDASLANGKKYYQINCAVCHGNAGDANGGLKRVNAGYGFAPSLMTPSATGRSDGYIYGIIRNGRGVMPNYNRIEDHDRWDVVNYVRALQKGGADTTLIGYPGQNGTTVPGPSMTAPTKPAPFLKPTQQPTPGSPNLNSGTYKGLNERDKMRELHGSSHEAKGGAESKEKHQ